MLKLFGGLAAGAALVVFATAGQACDFHASHVTASVAPVESTVAMSTYDPAEALGAVEESAPQAASRECAADAKDCVPSKE